MRPRQPVVARAHPIWLGEVVNNLLDNAQRYGGQRILLQVSALPEGGALVVVEDNGEGVTPEQLPRLFEPFWRGDRADLRNDGGTGLGLAIAREIVERLGGSLVAASRPEVDGMRFTVRCGWRPASCLQGESGREGLAAQRAPAFRPRLANQPWRISSA
jgi:two-component system sensor histidine kinase TctE